MAQVLCIEPDTVLAKTYVAALRSAGVSATYVSSAQEAILSIDRDKPQLIILEVQLAAHNGVEFLYELRSHHDWQDIPVLVLSLVPLPELGLSKELQQQLGVVGYAYKPQTKLRQLISLVRPYLSGKD